jgi:hypothetical protein
VKCSLATVVQENPSSSESESLLLVHVGKLVSSDPPGHGPYRKYLCFDRYCR